jgi:hypothetical protein
MIAVAAFFALVGGSFFPMTCLTAASLDRRQTSVRPLAIRSALDGDAP